MYKALITHHTSRDCHLDLITEMLWMEFPDMPTPPPVFQPAMTVFAIYLASHYPRKQQSAISRELSTVSILA